MSAPSGQPHPPTGGTELDVRPDVNTGGGDHDRFAHVCHKDDVSQAYITGEAIIALCGKRWVPSRDPERFPVCRTCMQRLAQGMRPERTLR